MTAEAVTAQNAHTGHVGGRMCAPSGRGLLQRPVRPVRIVVIDVLAKDQPPVVGAENAVTSCDLGVFVDQAAEPVPPQNPDIRGP